MAEESKQQRLYTKEEVDALLLKSAEDRIAHDKLVGCISVGFTGGVGGLMLGGPFGGLGGAAAGCWLGNKIAGDTSDAINMIPSASEMDLTIKKYKEEAERLGRAIGKTAEPLTPDLGAVKRAIEKTKDQLSGEQNYEKEIPSYPAPSEPTHGLSEQDLPKRKQQGR